MDHKILIESFAEFKEFKNIDRATMMNILKDVFAGMIRKKHNSDENFDIIVNPDKGDLEIWWNREVVDDEFAEDSFDYDENKHISLTEAHKIEPDFELGETVTVEVPLDAFGRRAVLNGRQNLKNRIMELEKEAIYQKYKDRVGDIIIGEVYQVWKKEILLKDDEGNELILPKTEQIPSDFYKKGDNVRSVILRVEMQGGTPKIILSRTAPAFLERLFELEVPEVFDGLITIKKIVREPGERAKVAVESYDDRIDPVGACVGMKGSRIHGIVRELRNENIDVINFTSNVNLLITRALSPARISEIKIDEETKRASVFMKPDQVSLAIGKGGHNIRLAGKLTGYEIDVYRDSEDESEDVDLDEFSDEIDAWIIDEFKKVGFDTAKSVITLPIDELVQRTDLEEETIREVVRILKSEFE
ncbi:MAG TPA: transcription termination factor NusA [Bacteroidia bacterium]|nr:transcription termination/antitermination protein NusA [Bacteroidota bacterium]HRC33176.1 transcription termination factor NusA [Bacteroidia bacterium]